MSETHPLVLPIDYYELLGLTPTHLLPPPVVHHQGMWGKGQRDGADLFAELPEPPRPPSAWEVDQAAYERATRISRNGQFTARERALRLGEIELGRRILGDDERRRRYDMIRLTWREGLNSSDRHRALRHLQEEVRAEIAIERGEQLDEDGQAALLRRGQDALAGGQYAEAARLLDLARAAQPDSLVAHYDYARALLAREDPLVMPAFPIRAAAQALEQACHIYADYTYAEALLAFCRGLLERDAGRNDAARPWFERAVQLDSGLGVAWRALAVLALQAGRADEALVNCRYALAANPQDERALIIAIAACLQQGNSAHAREAAACVAALRGPPWTGERVLGELLELSL